ncbi:protein wech-like [Mytilus trossulus]|uniref:protein wech-like n=1 Tax=Mytilus trossulus TaxID=6551 RepID=UPI003004AB54
MAQSASKTCDICVSAPGSWYCLDCEQHYCENCKILHSRQKLSTNHQFEKASDFIPEEKSKCNEHNEAFSFVCISCDVPVCGCCITAKHNGHKLSQFKDIIVQLKSKRKQEILTKLQKTSGNVSELEKACLSFNYQVETGIRSAKEESDKIKSMVDQYTAYKIVSIQEQARKESERLAAILSDHKIAFENANALNIRKSSIEKQSRYDGSLMKMLKTLNEDIDKLEIYPLPEFPSATYTPKEVNENDISQLLGRFELCSIATETFIENESRPLEHAEVRQSGKVFKCNKCGKQKIRIDNESYHVNHFMCCHMSMERHKYK